MIDVTLENYLFTFLGAAILKIYYKQDEINKGTLIVIFFQEFDRSDGNLNMSNFKYK